VIEFRVNTDSIGTQPYDAVDGAIMASYCWGKFAKYNKATVSIIKRKAKALGVNVEITQRYSKQWNVRKIKFNSEADYSMFLLKWTT